MCQWLKLILICISDLALYKFSGILFNDHKISYRHPSRSFKLNYVNASKLKFRYSASIIIINMI